VALAFDALAKSAASPSVAVSSTGSAGCSTTVSAGRSIDNPGHMPSARDDKHSTSPVRCCRKKRDSVSADIGPRTNCDERPTIGRNSGWIDNSFVIEEDAAADVRYVSMTY
jgi:hypothetical protein